MLLKKKWNRCLKRRGAEIFYPCFSLNSLRKQVDSVSHQLLELALRIDSMLSEQVHARQNGIVRNNFGGIEEPPFPVGGILCQYRRTPSEHVSPATAGPASNPRLLWSRDGRIACLKRFCVSPDTDSCAQKHKHGTGERHHKSLLNPERRVAREGYRGRLRCN